MAELEARRFRAQSDVLRSRESALQTTRVAASQAEQLRERAAAAATAATAERAVAEEAQRLSAVTLDQARVEAEAKRRLAVELRTVLDAQAAATAEARVHAMAAAAAEEARLAALAAAQADELRREEAALRLAARTETARMQEFNSTIQAQRKVVAAAGACVAHNQAGASGRSGSHCPTRRPLRLAFCRGGRRRRGAGRRAGAGGRRVGGGESRHCG